MEGGVSRRELLRRMVAEDHPEAKYYPASFSQQRLWFLAQLAPGNPFYNVEAEIPIVGAISADAIEYAINEICRRHESLRTTFREVDGMVVQRVAPAIRIGLHRIDLEAVPIGERLERKNEIVTREARRPFDLANGPLLRTTLIDMGDGRSFFLLNMHHIIADGWSMGVFSSELSEILLALAAGRRPSLPPLAIQYGDFAAWQRQHLSGQTLDEQLAYWREQLTGAPLLRLPTDYVRPPVQTFNGAYLHFKLDPALTEEVRKFCRAHDVTLFMFALAAFNTLLHRYSGQTDLVVGTYIANRTRAETERLIGFFLNTLVLRTRLEGDPSFEQLLGIVREVCLGAYAHQDLPFEKVVEDLNPGRDLSRNPLFQVTFQVHNSPTQQLDDSASASLDFKRGTAIFDLCFMMFETPRQIVGHFEYSTDLFAPSTMQQLAAHYVQLVRAVISAPSTALSSINFLTDGDRDLLRAMNDTAVEDDDARGVVERFAATAASHADSIACFTSSGEAATYAQLERRADALAAALRARDVGCGVPVAVALPRALDVPAALLAVLKAGGVYLPLDPAYPLERLRFMLENARAPVLLTTSSLAPSFAGIGAEVLDIDAISDAAFNPSSTPADQPAFIIYTSGSTGVPKGVATSHRQLLARLRWMERARPFEAGEVCAQKTALSFIDSIAEILSPLLCGVPLLLLTEEESRDPLLLVRALDAARVTRLWIVPSQLRSLLDSCGDLSNRLRSLRFWVSTGEKLTPALVARFRAAAPQASLFNLYGLTETWDAAWFDTAELRPGAEVVPIGRPIDGVTLHVLDSRRRTVPPGALGELYVAGSGVSDGYIARDDETASRFVTMTDWEGTARRAFRTGDLARVTAEGVVEVIGRSDHQVKIRGHRVEIEEIERILAEHPAVQDAAVIARVLDEETHLAAFFVAAAELPLTELRAYLATKLPLYLIPGSFTALPALPRTPSGKTDRAALAAVTAPVLAASRTPAAPSTAIETQIAAIWREVLRRPSFGIDDDFFAAGGHSLLATQVISRIRARFGVDISLRTFFDHPTIRALARLVPVRGSRRRRRPRAARVLRRLQSLRAKGRY